MHNTKHFFHFGEQLTVQLHVSQIIFNVTFNPYPILLENSSKYFVIQYSKERSKNGIQCFCFFTDDQVITAWSHYNNTTQKGSEGQILDECPLIFDGTPSWTNNSIKHAKPLKNQQIRVLASRIGGL